jgi:hypothetical protein
MKYFLIGVLSLWVIILGADGLATWKISNSGHRPICPFVIVEYSDVRGEFPVYAGESPATFGGGVTVTNETGGIVRINVGRFRPSQIDSASAAGYTAGRNDERREFLRKASARAAAHADTICSTNKHRTRYYR